MIKFGETGSPSDDDTRSHRSHAFSLSSLLPPPPPSRLLVHYYKPTLNLEAGRPSPINVKRPVFRTCPVPYFHRYVVQLFTDYARGLPPTNRC